MSRAVKRTYKLNPESVEAYRQREKLTSEALVSAAGVHERTLKRWLAGGSAYLSSVLALAKVLHVKPQDIVDDFEPTVTKPEPFVNFSLGINVSGAATSPEQIGLLVSLTQEVIGRLQQAGIAILDHQTNITLQERQGGENTRIIEMIWGLLGNGNPFWLFAAVKPAKHQAFIIAQKEGALNLDMFEPYGEIILWGEGDDPPNDAVVRVAEMFKTTPQLLMASAKR